MKIIITNKSATIVDPSSDLIEELWSRFSYKDKSKEFQLKKMSKNPFLRNSQAYKDISQSLDHSLLTQNPDGSVSFPVGLLSKFDVSGYEVEDLRKETGLKINLPWKTKPFDLRPYQQEAVDNLHSSYRGLVKLATGCGKTLTAVHAIRVIGRKTLVVCPSTTICDQFHEILCSAFGDDKVGYFGGGKKKIKDITVGIAASVSNHIEDFKKADLGAIFVDECLPYRQHISTEEGPTEIGSLVSKWEKGLPLPRVKSWNSKDQIFEYKEITHCWRRVRSDLVTVKYSKRKFQCTPNHLLLTAEGWKPAGELITGDLLIGMTGDKTEKHITPEFNSDQLDFLVGSFLGDGSVGKAGLDKYRLSFTHGIKQYDYAKWKSELIHGSIRILAKNGYAQTEGVRVASKVFNLSKEMPSDKTYCPDWIIDSINAKSLAVWFMDDGSISKKGNSARLATCSFDEESVVKLSNKLTSMGIECKPIFIKYRGIRAPGYWEIYINKIGTETLKRTIGPYVHKSMLYKVNNEEFSTYTWNTQFLSYGHGLVHSVTPSVNNRTRTPYVFDIEVADNHNFIVCSANDNSGVVAHNCHHTPADTFYRIAEGLGEVGRLYGLTATDFRSDGKDILINAACGRVLVDYDVVWGIQNGFLAQPSFLIRSIDSNGKDYPDDKLKNYKSHVLNSTVTKAQILKDAQSSLAAGKKVMILVDEIAHGQELAQQLGLPFATGVDKNSDKYINDFNAGRVQGLIGTEGKLGEGVDTRPVQVLIMANFVAAKGAVLQAIGRGLRMTDTKKSCLIIDYRIINSRMLSRHCDSRIKIYKSITDKVIISPVQ